MSIHSSTSSMLGSPRRNSPWEKASQRRYGQSHSSLPHSRDPLVTHILLSHSLLPPKLSLAPVHFRTPPIYATLATFCYVCQSCFLYLLMYVLMIMILQRGMVKQWKWILGLGRGNNSVDDNEKRFKVVWFRRVYPG